VTAVGAREEILALEQRRCGALLAADVEALAPLLSERLVFMHANALPDDRASLLEKMRGGRIVYRTLSVSEEMVVDLGEVALLHARLSAAVEVAGQPRRIENRTLSVWAREEGTWRLLAYQPTPIPG